MRPWMGLLRPTRKIDLVEPSGCHSDCAVGRGLSGNEQRPDGRVGIARVGDHSGKLVRGIDAEVADDNGPARIAFRSALVCERSGGKQNSVRK